MRKKLQTDTLDLDVRAMAKALAAVPIAHHGALECILFDAATTASEVHSWGLRPDDKCKCGARQCYR